MRTVLELKTNADGLGTAIDEAGRRLLGANYGKASETFGRISSVLRGEVLEHIDSGSFVGLADATIRYKQSRGWSSAPWVASGATRAGVSNTSGATWAKALRGSREWWTFLHDKGRGYSHWSLGGDSRAGAGKRRHRAGNPPVPGTTKFPQRQVFFISEGGQTKVVGLYESLVNGILEEVGG